MSPPMEASPPHARRSLVLCFDGTALKFSGTPSDSNILKLYSLLNHQDPNQYSYYQPGIGTYVEHRSISQAHGLYTRLHSWWSKQQDQMVGTSFAEHVVAGYKFLMRFYREDDDIYMFGFSRGAYTARFLAEMLDYVGLLQAGNEEMVRFAWKAFSNWQTRRSGSHKRAKNEASYEFMKKFRETFSRPVKPIRFLGLFDTVNSVPLFEVAWMQRTKYPYTARTSAKTIRHAVAIDERRSRFRQDLIGRRGKQHEREHHFREWAEGLHEEHGWKHETGRATGPGSGMDEKDDSFIPKPIRRRTSKFRATMHHGRKTNKDFHFADVEEQLDACGDPLEDEEPRVAKDDEDEQDIREVFFPGSHGDIGGGWPILPNESPNPISHVPLLWMIREALSAGVPFDLNKLHASNFFPHNCAPKPDPPPVPPSKDPVSSRPIQSDLDALRADLRTTFAATLKSAEASRVHDCLEFGAGETPGTVVMWKALEYMPFRRMDLHVDGTWRPTRWPLPMGEARNIPRGAIIHGSAVRRMNADPTYRPANLIIGGGGRMKGSAPKELGVGKWRCVKDEGQTLGELYMREGDVEYFEK